MSLPNPKPSRSDAAFSLIEIILAIAVIAFALTAILGMFPVAVSAATDSQRETQAALIARSIFDQLQARTTTSTRSFTLDTSASGTSDPSSLKQTDIELSTPHTYSNIAILDSNSKPVSSVDDPLMTYKVDIAVAPLPAPNEKLSQVTITVNTRSKGTKYFFTTFIRQ